MLLFGIVGKWVKHSTLDCFLLNKQNFFFGNVSHLKAFKKLLWELLSVLKDSSKSGSRFHIYSELRNFLSLWNYHKMNKTLNLCPIVFVKKSPMNKILKNRWNLGQKLFKSFPKSFQKLYLKKVIKCPLFFLDLIDFSGMFCLECFSIVFHIILEWFGMFLKF